MLGIVKLVRRLVEGSVVSIVLVAIVALLGVSETINVLLAERSVSALLFLLVLAIVLADLIAKLITIFTNTFPDLIPKVDDDDLERASLIGRLRPGQTVALLSGANSARVLMFVAIFALLGWSYAAAPAEAQALLVGSYSGMDAFWAFLREGVAGSIGYFLFFLGADNLAPITGTIAEDRLVSSSVEGDFFLAGIRLYGLAFILAVLRTLVTPITFVRARLRARNLAA